MSGRICVISWHGTCVEFVGQVVGAGPLVLPWGPWGSNVGMSSVLVRHLYPESLFWLTYGFLHGSHPVARPTSYSPSSPDDLVLMVNLLSWIPGCEDYVHIWPLYFFICITIFIPKQVCDLVCHSSALPVRVVFPEPQCTPDHSYH